MRNIANQFSRQFEIVRANTPPLLIESLRLRYQVYCLETGYEDSGAWDDPIEFDDHDLSSVHSVIRHKATQMLAANVRLILHRPETSGDPFPIQGVIKAEELREACERCAGELESFAEISRFCVSKQFKRRYNEASSVAGIDETAALTESVDGNALLSEMGREYYSANVDTLSGTRLLPHITIALFAAIFEMSAEEGVQNWFAIMEPSLLRFLGRYGIEFTPMGELINYRGQRQPCFANADQVALGIWKKRPDVWRFVTQNGQVWPLPAKQPLSENKEAHS